MEMKNLSITYNSLIMFKESKDYNVELYLDFEIPNQGILTRNYTVYQDIYFGSI